MSANDLDSARRSINYLFADWANDGPNLFAVDQQRIDLTTTDLAYTLSTDTVAILQATVRVPQNSTLQDLMISPISRAEYLALPKKDQKSDRPTQFYLERTQPPVVYVWPLPQTSGMVLIYYRMRVIQDVGKFINSPDAPARWMEAIASGAAKKLALKWAKDRYADLATEAGIAYGRAKFEDRERVPLRISPDLMGGQV